MNTAVEMIENPSGAVEKISSKNVGVYNPLVTSSSESETDVKHSHKSVPKNNLLMKRNEKLSSSSTIKVEEFRTSERLFQFCGIAIAAIFGAYVRIGIQYYKLWRIETNYVSFLLVSCTSAKLIVWL